MSGRTTKTKSYVLTHNPPQCPKGGYYHKPTRSTRGKAGRVTQRLPFDAAIGVAPLLRAEHGKLALALFQLLGFPEIVLADNRTIPFYMQHSDSALPEHSSDEKPSVALRRILLRAHNRHCGEADQLHETVAPLL